ncbi:MAG: protein kinase [bacterium]
MVQDPKSDRPKAAEGARTEVDTSAEPVSGIEVTVAPGEAEPLSGLEATVAPGNAEPVSGTEATVAITPDIGASGVEETLPVGSRPGAARPLGEEGDLGELLTVPRDHYSDGAEFARGGMGRIVAARDRRLGRAVALKELLVARPDLRRRFEQEARITGRLQHPSIVPIYECGRWPSGEPFYAMKHIKGRPLSDLIQETRGAAERLALLPKVTAVAEAIAYAHSRRVIHRDLKPQNVLVGDFGETVVIDWGLAKELDVEELAEDAEEGAGGGEDEGDGGGAGEGLTVAGSVMGTPAYMPPEQARGEAVDERADVYALGAILYNCLGGAPPYCGKTSDQVLGELLAGPPPSLRERQPDLPPDLLSIVDKAMEPAAEDRYPTADALAADLRRYQTGQLVGAHHYGGAALLRRWARRNRLAVSITSVFLLVLAVLGAVSIQRVVSARNRAEAERRRAVRASGEAKRSALEARRNAAAATERLASFYADEGRRELLAGHPQRALAYLAEARRLGHGGLAHRILLAHAARLAEPLLAAVEAHRAAIELVAYDASGKVLLTAGYDRMLKWWSPGDLQLLERFPLVGYPIRFSPDSRELLVSQRTHSTLALVDLRGKIRCTLRGLKKVGVLRAVYSPDGARVAAWVPGGPVMVWDTKACRVLSTLELEPTAKPEQEPELRRLFARSFGPGGRRLALATPANTAELWDVDTGKRVVTLAAGHSGKIVEMDFSASGKLLATASQDGTARVWDAEKGTLQHELKGHRRGLTQVVFDRLGGRVATASLDRTVRLWDTRTGALVALLKGHGNAVKGLVWSADDRRLLSLSDDRTLRLWDAASGAFIASFEGHLDHISAAAFSPRGQRVASVSHDHRLRLWNAALDVAHHSAGRSVRLAALSRDGSRVLLVGAQGELWLGGSKPGAALDPLGGAGAEVTAAAFGPRGDRVLVARIDGTVELWSRRGGRPLRVLKGHTERVDAVVFGPRGKRLATASWDETARIWDAATGRQLLRLEGHRGEVTQVAWSPDGRRVATTCSDGLARIFSARRGTLMATVGVTGSKLVAGEFSADSRRLVTVSDTLSILTWRTRDGAMLSSVEGQSGDFTRASLAAGGALVLTSSGGRAALWDTRTGKPIARFDEGGGAAISAGADRVVTIDGKRRTATIRVIPQARLSAGSLERLVARSPWRLRDRRLIRQRLRPGWLRVPQRPAPPAGAPLLHEPALGFRLERTPGWGITITDDSYELERRFGQRIRMLVFVLQGRAELRGDDRPYVASILQQDLRVKFMVSSHWSQFAGLPCLLLQGPQLTGQASRRWVVVPRGRGSLILTFALDGASWEDPEAKRAFRELEGAVRYLPPWTTRPHAQRGALRLAGDLAQIILPDRWRLKRYGPGAALELAGPEGTRAGLRVLGPRGAVWCQKEPWFPTPQSVRLGAVAAQRYTCPEDDEDQVFYVIRRGRHMLYLGLTDARTKALTGPVTQLVQAVRFPRLAK